MAPRIRMVAAVIAFATACSGGDDETAPTTTAPPVETTTTTAVLPGPGNPRVTTTLSADLQGGGASIIGLVIGPAGPVDGAIVRVERLVGSTVAGADVASAGGGRWEIRGIKGGRYRVRAWRAPDLAQVAPDVFFLQATEARNLDLRVLAFGLTAEGTFAPSPPSVGQPSTLSVLVTSGTVGSEGIVQVLPRTNLIVQLSAPGALTVQTPAAQVTDASGRATWRVQCLQAGAFPINLTADAGIIPVTAPPCGGAAPPSGPTTTTR